MSRILNVASAAAVVMTAGALLFLSEAGRANDLAAAASVTPVVLPQPAAPVEPDAALPAPVTALETPNSDAPVVDKVDEAVALPLKAESLAALVSATPHVASPDAELQCLAAAVYFESRSESLTGQLAVAHVVINRAESGRFPRSLCGVVHQKSQFSFVRGGRMPAINTAGKQWRNAVAIAQIAQNDGWKNQAPGALFFHATHVSPGWNRPRVAQIDNHIFYR